CNTFALPHFSLVSGQKRKVGEEGMRGWRRGQHPREGEPPGHRPGDADLVVAAQRDPRAFAPLYARYQDDLLRYAYYGLGDWDDAADAAQQVFANALATLGNFQD